MGRKKTTGRYNTRKELEYAIGVLYKESPQDLTQIARLCRISYPTAVKILKKLHKKNKTVYHGWMRDLT